MKNKWFGILHHVVGEHEWHDGQCSHGALTAAETGKPLLEKGSKAMDVLRKVIMDKRWVESLIFYVWFKHTSFLENFNSMMLKYAPKRNSFAFIAFCIRMLLAAIDHNTMGSYSGRSSILNEQNAGIQSQLKQRSRLSTSHT